MNSRGHKATAVPDVPVWFGHLSVAGINFCEDVYTIIPPHRQELAALERVSSY